MAQIRLFTDEDIYGAIASAMRLAGFDAVSTPETNRLGESDEAQLSWAATEGRVLVTFNVAHFVQIHTAWLNRNRSHAGLIVSAQRPVGDVLRRLMRLANALSSDDMLNRLEFLGDW